MIFQCLPSPFLAALLAGVHNLNSDTIKIALYTSGANLGPNTGAYTASGEITATGYTPGGQVLSPLGIAYSGTTGYTSFAPITWTNSGIVADGALIYNATAAGNPAIMVLSFGLTRYSDTNGNFTITFPVNDSQNAILRINAPIA